MIKLYHGSDTEIVKVDLSHSLYNKDFGKGFYLSDDVEQAWSFARYKAAKPKSSSTSRPSRNHPVRRQLLQSFCSTIDYLQMVRFVF